MIDAFGRKITYLRLSVTELCNLRCRYCMTEEGICQKEHKDILTEDEMITAVEAAASLGISKLRITGGEPLVKKNIVSICERAAKVPGIEHLCITTNGTLLKKLAQPLKDVGVKHINISLDTLDPEKYARITRCGKLEDAISGLEAALDAGFEKVKVNAVLIGGFNDDEIVTLANLTKTYGVDMRFIELMPMFVNETFGEGSYLPTSAVLEKLPEAEEDFSRQQGSVARIYRLPGAKGHIGLISPLSEHFCGECNRLRLTADGKLKPCLHSPMEFSIKGLDKAAMCEQFQKAIMAKPERHALNSIGHSEAGRSMNQIGG